MSLNDFETIKLLGKGAFASVYQVKRKKDGNIYAMKRVKFAAMSSKEKDNALNEVRILASVQHRNIIGYKESFYDEESKTLNIIMDFADEGDLDCKIKKHIQNRTNFPENEIWSYLIQILMGLRSLHNVKIMHRDLKCANIFLKSGIIQLGDLNVSKLIKRSQMDHTQTGTPYYASPEVWSNKPYDYKSDIWSVGCIIYELCALKPPFRASGLEELYKAVTKGKYEPIPRIYSQELGQIIAIMLQVEQSLRPDVSRLLSNPLILRKMDYANIENQDKESLNMLNTIKVPKNLKEINNQLPKQKNYGIGEVILERKNSEENVRPMIMDKRVSDQRIIDQGKNNVERNKNPQNHNNIAVAPQYKIGNNYNINNPSNIVKSNRPSAIGQIPSNNYLNRDVNKIQDQRAALLNKYNNNPSSLNNDRDRIRPRTPDVIPNRNVYEIKKQNNNHILNNNNKNIPSYKPSNIVDNPYIIKK
jgi:NIMA (never in mitosis gene a)-related kinase 1/4/5